MRGCMWRKLTSYWSGKWNPPNALDSAIVQTARIGFKYGYREDEIVSTIKRFCEALPQEASSRLSNPREVMRCIKKQVKGVATNAGQKDQAKSDRILERTVSTWKAKGKDLLNRMTWGTAGGYEGATPYNFNTIDKKLAEADLDVAMPRFVPAFPKKWQFVVKQNLERVMFAMARLADIKYREGNGISVNYWQAFFRDQFLMEMGIRNVWNVLRAALDLGIIQKADHCFRGRATVYCVGPRMRGYFTTSTPPMPIRRRSQREKMPADVDRRIEEAVPPFGTA